MNKEIIYYTDNELDPMIKHGVRMMLYESGLPIISSSLQSIPFGDNNVIEGKRSYPTMVNQIVDCLERSKADIVFFCEHDVLYHPKYFQFIPVKDDTFYYNLNNWRWPYRENKLIQYDGLTSLSQMCCYRQLALNHFKCRQKRIQELGSEVFNSREPSTPRKWGYEPGRKPTSNGGFSDEKSEVWTARYPNIDIRHSHTYSPPKTTLAGFKHPPTGWKETTLDDIDGWNLRELFHI